ncbi:MAG: hypothetical protein C0504_13260 [Candidatus Solibacter sp.]|nr:hypothetical protein [Candidatus Solibacter sp.]
MLQKYSHYFALPLASRDLSAAAATSQIAGLALAAVGGFIEFWWGILFAIINWIIMGISAVKISPISLISSSIEAEIANEEVLSFLEAKRSQRRKEQSRNQSE